MKTRLAAAAVGTALLITPAAALASSSHTASPNTTKNGTSVQATVNQQIPLTPGPAFHRAHGSAQYQAQPGQSEFQVEISRLAPLAGNSLLVQVNGAKVGWMKVSKTGIAQLNRNSELGQHVPMIMHGSTVTVKTKKGTVIATGTF
jgi:hypothetical protein